MGDSKKTKSQLLEELAALRRRVAVLEAAPLHDREERFRAMADASPVRMFLVDAQGKNVYSNHVWCQVTGYTFNEALGDGWSKVIHPKDRDRVFSEWEAYRRNHTTFDHVLRYLSKDGKVIWVRVRISPVRDGTSLLGHVGVVEDITEHRRAEEALKNSEERYRSIFESAINMIHVVDDQHRIIDVNETELHELGYSRSELIGKPLQEIIHPAFRAVTAAVIPDVRSGETIKSYESALLTKDGNKISVVANVVPRMVEGKFCGAQAILQDITERKRVEDALRASEERYRTLVETVPHGIEEIDASGIILVANAAHHEQYEYADGELIGMSILDLVATDSEREELRHYLNVLVTEQPPPTPYIGQKRTKQGKVIDVKVAWNYKRDAQGQVTGFTSVITDITEPKRAGEAQKRLVAILEGTTDFVGSADRDRRLRYVNRAGREMVGVGNDEDVSKFSISDFHPEWTTQLLFEHAVPRAARDGTWTGEVAFLHRDGHEIPVLMVLVVHKAPGGDIEFFSTISHDITARKRAQDALRASEARYQNLYHNAPDMFASIDIATAEVVQCNQTLVAATGYRREDILGRPVIDLHHSDSIEDAGKVLESLRQTGDVRDAELQLKRKDGSKFDVGLRVSVVQDEQGKAYGRAIWRDITERKRAEAQIKELEAQFREAQRLEAIGRLAGGIAHDFNNTLGVIRGYAGFLLEDPSQGDRARQDIRGIDDAAMRAAALTRQLLAFGRLQGQRLEVLELNTVVGDLAEMLQRALGEDIILNTLMSEEPLYVKVDKSQIDQLVMNLAVNARDAMPAGGSLVIETAHVCLGEDYGRAHADVWPGEYVVLTVTDTGSGMSKETQARIFEPFFTTKSRSVATGLGLSTVYGIVKQSGGSITVHSEPGHGATFKIYLPRVETAEPVVVAPRAVTDAVGGTETILVVEDEEDMRRVARRILEENGYTILEAEAGRVALQVFAQHNGPIHLLLTDVVMPRMSGCELADRLRQARSNLRVLYMSGYAPDATLHEDVLQESSIFVQKPFTAAELLGKVRQALSAPGKDTNDLSPPGQALDSASGASVLKGGRGG